MFLSYIFAKTYQLSGYQIRSYLKSVLELKLSFGDKNRLIFTKRMIRFSFLLFIIMFGMFFVVNYFINNIYLKLFDIILLFLLLPLFIVLTHYIILPLELLIKKHFMAKATRKLRKKKIIKIGITGSYGKTSTKNILVSMLEKNYKVCATPKNYNTEMGLSKTILNDLDDHDIFVAEMGARHIGDIKILAKMVEPNYGIITTIGPQHLETFKSIEVIENTKFELAENLKPDGVMVFNGDSQSSRKLYDRFKGEKYLACDKEGYSYADNIKMDSQGSTFDLFLNGQKLEVKTKLLGKCNIDNIVTASTLAHLLGITYKDIISAIKDLSPSKHRLELMKNNYCTIIDDSYNCNIVGSKEALDVLSRFEGRKIVITPGMVELGNEQSQANFKLGTLIADVADYIIIMNNVNKNEILSGAISHNFNREHIFFAETRKKQKEILELITTKDCVVLFENDLPDNYK